MSRPASGGCAVAFVLLVVAGSALVTLPASSADPAAIAAFYDRHGTAVTLTQAAGLLAVPALLGFVHGLRSRVLLAAAAVIAAGQLLTAIPVLLLAGGAGDGTGLTQLSERGDDLLFAGVAAFAATIALRPGLRILAGPVAVLAAVRCVAGLLGVPGPWDAAAPLTFLLLVLAAGLPLLRGVPAVTARRST